MAEEMYDDQRKDWGTHIHEGGRVLGGLYPVPDDCDEDDDDDGDGDYDDDDLLKTTKEHTTTSRSNDWCHLLHFQNEQLFTPIY